MGTIVRGVCVHPRQMYKKGHVSFLVCVCVCVCTLSDDKGGGVLLAILLHEVQGPTLVLQACLFPRLTGGGSCCESVRV